MRAALGTMSFGTGIDEAGAFALLDRFVERGGQWIDTADCYAFWASDEARGDESETVIGRWLAARPGSRERVRLSTKVGAQPVGRQGWRGWPANREGLSAAAIVQATEESAARLGVERIDLLWLHQPDHRATLEETVEGLEAVYRRGLVARTGASNFPAWEVERMRALAIARGIPPVQAVQLALTYLRPRPGATPPGNDHQFGQASAEQLDHAERAGLGVWAYTPLLRGAYDDAARDIPDAFVHDGSARRLEALARVAEELALSPGQVVLSWLAGRGVRPVVGVSSVKQLDAALDAVSRPLPERARALLDDVEP